MNRETERSLSSVPGVSATIDLDRQPSARTSRPLVYGAFGIAVAALALGGVAVAKLFWFDGDQERGAVVAASPVTAPAPEVAPAPSAVPLPTVAAAANGSDSAPAVEGAEPTGTLAVAVADQASADIFIDGTKRGSVADGRGWTSEPMAVAQYEVVVRRAGAPDCRQSAQVRAGEVSFVMCQMEAEPERSDKRRSRDEGGQALARAEPSSSSNGRRNRPRRRVPAPSTSEQDDGDDEADDADSADGASEADGSADTRIAAATSDGAGAERALLVATTNPRADIWLDGKDTGEATGDGARIPIEAGAHKVTFVIGDAKFSYRILAKPGEVVRLRKELPTAP